MHRSGAIDHATTDLPPIDGLVTAEVPEVETGFEGNADAWRPSTRSIVVNRPIRADLDLITGMGIGPLPAVYGL